MLTDARTGATVGAAPAQRRSNPAGIPADLWVLAGLTALAAVLRFATLTHQSYWFDEAQAVHEMHRSFVRMLSLWSSNEPNPPLYFVLAWPWAKLFGTGEAGLRSLSAVLGVAVIPIVWLCGRELVSSRAGLVAAALAAVNPFLIWYSQEAREYMLLTALCGASVLCFARALRAPSARNLAWWAGVAALALATQYFAAFLIFAEALWLLYAIRARAAAIAVAVTVAVEAALLPHAIEHASHPSHWISLVGPLSVRVKQLPVAFAFNTLYKGGGAILGDALLGAALLAGIVIVLLIVAAGERELRGAGIAAALAAFVVLVPLALALVGRRLHQARATRSRRGSRSRSCSAPPARPAAPACPGRRLRPCWWRRSSGREAGSTITSPTNGRTGVELRPRSARDRPARDRRVRRHVRDGAAGDLSARCGVDRQGAESARPATRR